MALRDPIYLERDRYYTYPCRTNEHLQPYPTHPTTSTNNGLQKTRRQSQYWHGRADDQTPPATTQHPHCRCVFLVLVVGFGFWFGWQQQWERERWRRPICQPPGSGGGGGGADGGISASTPIQARCTEYVHHRTHRRTGRRTSQTKMAGTKKCRQRRLQKR